MTKSRQVNERKERKPFSQGQAVMASTYVSCTVHTWSPVRVDVTSRATRTKMATRQTPRTGADMAPSDIVLRDRCENIIIVKLVNSRIRISTDKNQ